MDSIYLDNAATTPVLEEVVDIMTQTLSASFGNPSSIHSQGRTAKSIIENTRKSIAKELGAQPKEIIFTSKHCKPQKLKHRPEGIRVFALGIWALFLCVRP